MNKKDVLLLILLLCISIIFVGCGDTPKAPDNFDKDLWQDSVNVVRIIYNVYEKDDNFSVKDEDVIKEYFNIYENRLYDNDKEDEIIYIISDLYESYKSYIFAKSTFSDKEYVSEHKNDVAKIFNELQNSYENIIK